MRPCVVCEADSKRIVEDLGEFRMIECDACGVQFTDPMTYSEETYDLAYEGTQAAPNGMDSLVPFVSWTAEDGRGLPMWRHFLTAAQQAALRDLGAEHPRGARLLDIGCGGGWWLAAAQANGFETYGLEVGRRPVNVLREHGFRVAQGSINDFPPDWPSPNIMTLFEVLEHLSDPVQFLRDIRARFPDAGLVLSVPSPNRWLMLAGRDTWDYPPNHLTRWTSESLRLALRKAGYAARIRSPKPTPTEMSMIGIRPFMQRMTSRIQGRSLSPKHNASGEAAKPFNRSLSHEVRVRRLKRIAFALPCIALRVAGYDCASMLAIANGSP